MGIVETVKDVAMIVQKTDNIELVKQVLSLQSQALDMQEENRALRARIGELEAILDLAKAVTFQAPFYIAPGDAVPFCARCWEADRRAVHLKSDWNGRRWECFQCGKVYLFDETARPRVMFDAM